MHKNMAYLTNLIWNESDDKTSFTGTRNYTLKNNLVFFQNEWIFVQLDEVDELDTHKRMHFLVQIIKLSTKTKFFKKYFNRMYTC